MSELSNTQSPDISQVHKLLEANNPSAAEELCSRLCALDPGNTDAWYLLGAIAGQLGDYTKCEACNRKVLEQHPDIFSAHTNLASALMLQGHLEEAESSFQDALRLNPNDAQTLNNLGNLLGQQGKHEDACSSYRRALTIYPDYAEAHNNLAGMLQQLEEYAEARLHYEKALQLQPSYLEAKTNLAGLAARMGDTATAINNLAEIIELHPVHTDSRLRLAQLLRDTGRTDEAMKHLHYLVDSQPAAPIAHNQLGSILCQQGDYAGAILHCQQAVSQKSDFAEAHLSLGLAFHCAGNLQQAAGCYEKALTLNPELDDAYANLAKLYVMLGMFEKARQCYQSILGRNPESKLAINGIGHVLKNDNRYDEARKYFEDVLEKDPDFISAKVGLVTIEEQQGNYQQAFELVKPLLDEGVQDSQLSVTFAKISKHLGRQAEAIKNLEDTLAHSRTTAKEKLDLHFALGKLYDNVAEYDKAFRHFHAGNNQLDYHFDMQDHRRTTDTLISTFSADFIASAPQADTVSDTPIFIVGMPRSGTSLVEQIIASHPDAFGAGELPHIMEISSQLQHRAGDSATYPGCVRAFSAETANSLADEYLRHIETLNTAGAIRVTDKMPYNFLHLGLIQLLFPGARVIHCLREPVDTCLSCFFQYFLGRHDYTCDLASLGSVYNEYRRLMDHWKRSLSLPILEIQYEDLVKDQEQKSRELIEFCDLTWDDQCLNFHKSRRIVKTASYEQVRNPMYSSSVGRWKNYREHLTPLQQTLNKDYWPDGLE